MPIDVSSKFWSRALAGLAGDPEQIEPADLEIVEAAEEPWRYDVLHKLVDENGKIVSGVILPDLVRHMRVASALMRDGACLETQAAVTKSLNTRLSAFMSDRAGVARALHGPASSRLDFDGALSDYSRAFGAIASSSRFRLDATGEALGEWNEMQAWLEQSSGHHKVHLHTELGEQRGSVTAVPRAQAGR